MGVGDTFVSVSPSSLQRLHRVLKGKAMRVRKLERERGWAFVVAEAILRPTLLSAVGHTWIDGEKTPASGGCVVVLNHISHIDPLLSAHLVYDHGRVPRYLAKSGLFKNKFLGGFLKSAGQIPVERLSRNSAGAFDAAVNAVNEGECVVVYPEGTLTRDRDLWPMVGKTGAARIALATGSPVIPVGHWGAQEVLYPYSKRPRLIPRKRVVMKVGDPVTLDDLYSAEVGVAATKIATDRIMNAITELVEDLRGAKAPTDRFDPRKAGVAEFGNPDDEKKRRRS